MRNTLLRGILIAVITLGILFIPANSDKVYSDEIDDLLEEQRRLEEELADIRNQKAYIDGLISSEQSTQQGLYTSISYISNQIKSTELTIAEKESEIEKKTTEIELLGLRIDVANEQITSLKNSIEHLTGVVTSRTKTSYISSKVSPLELVLNAGDVDELIKRLKYFSAIRKHDKKLMEDLDHNKDDLEFEEFALGENKLEVELILTEIESEKEELENAREELEWQKSEKDKLVADSEWRETQHSHEKDNLNQEEQQKLAEVAKIQDEIALLSIGLNGSAVERGDTIGQQGSTGYSSGSHLHFGVYQSGVPKNPNTYINNGTLDKPLDSYYFTQLYGYTDFATRCQPAAGETGFDWNECMYGPPMQRQIWDTYAYPQYYWYYPYDWDGDGYPNIHNGIDIVNYDGAPVKAAGTGTVCYGHDGFGAQYAKIDHGNGLLTMYWHLKEMNLNTCY